MRLHQPSVGRYKTVRIAWWGERLQVLVAVGESSANGPLFEKISSTQALSLEIETVADRVLARFESADAPDVLLLDFNFPGLSGLKGIQTALEFIGDRPLGILVPDLASADFKYSFAAGVRGVLPFDLSAEAFTAAVALLRTGVSFAVIDQPRVRNRLKTVSSLSEREVQVLAGICNGLQNKEIAHAFNIKEVTVKMHVRSIIRKLGARNRTHAAVMARELGIA